MTHPAKGGSTDLGPLWSLQQQFVDGREHSTAADVTEYVWSQLSPDSNGPVRGLGSNGPVRRLAQSISAV